VRSGMGIATLRIGPLTQLRIVDALITGQHEPARATSSCCARFRRDDVLRARRRRQVQRTIARTSSAIRCSSRKGSGSSRDIRQPNGELIRHGSAQVEYSEVR
jgi:hypothetical protein